MKISSPPTKKTSTGYLQKDEIDREGHDASSSTCQRMQYQVSTVRRVVDYILYIYIEQCLKKEGLSRHRTPTLDPFACAWIWPLGFYDIMALFFPVRPEKPSLYVRENRGARAKEEKNPEKVI